MYPTAQVHSSNVVRFTAENTYNYEPGKFVIKNGARIFSVKEAIYNHGFIDIIISGNLDIKYETTLHAENLVLKVSYNKYYSSDDFNKKYVYDGDLGISYSKKHTVFKLWSPIATKVVLLLHKASDSESQEKPYRLNMHEKNNIWYAKVEGDLDGFFYTYEIEIYDNTEEVVDPYAFALGVNGLRGAIIDLHKSNPEGFSKDKGPELHTYTDAIIYELSVRDMTSHSDSGVEAKGKYIGLTEQNTKSPKGISTGLAHLLELGITHLQLMPVFDFSCNSTDEKNPICYNWGYDPQNYSAPEGSYSSNPYDGYARVTELKTLIQSLHKNNIGVNMDVVYNHIYKYEESNLQKLFPDYYFRTYDDGSISNGSGCGNDIASERHMVRKLIIDSLSFWVKEYHIDGFRFDLMGLHDIDTMLEIQGALKAINKNIMLYGEGWNLNTSLANDKRATSMNCAALPDFAFFNDTVRDAIKGPVFNSSERGYVSGKAFMEQEIRKTVLGSFKYNDSLCGHYVKPSQSINYSSCHDNLALWDKLEASNLIEGNEMKKAMVKLAFGITLLSQGVPLFDEGSEFCRTKQGVENSYNSPDYINSIDWYRKGDYFDVFVYVKGLIEVRKSHAAFRCNDIAMIRSKLEFIYNTPENVVAFMLKDNMNGDSWKNILVVFNPNKYPVEVHIPPNDWLVVVNDSRAGNDAFEFVQGNVFIATPISTTVMYSNK